MEVVPTRSYPALLLHNIWSRKAEFFGGLLLGVITSVAAIWLQYRYGMLERKHLWDGIVTASVPVLAIIVIFTVIEVHRAAASLHREAETKIKQLEGYVSADATAMAPMPSTATELALEALKLRDDARQEETTALREQTAEVVAMVVSLKGQIDALPRQEAAEVDGIHKQMASITNNLNLLITARPRHITQSQETAMIDGAMKSHKSFIGPSGHTIKLAIVSMGNERETVDYRDDLARVFNSISLTDDSIKIGAVVGVWEGTWPGYTLFLNKVTLVEKGYDRYGYARHVIGGALSVEGIRSGGFPTGNIFSAGQLPGLNITPDLKDAGTFLIVGKLG